MSYSGNSNGVGYRIDPYFIGKDGDDFLTNPNGGTPQSVYIAFDRDVLSASLQIRGATGTGGTVIGYDVNGNQVDTKSIPVSFITQISTLLNTGSIFNRFKYAQFELRGSNAKPLRSIRIIPRSGDSLGMKGISLFSASTPYQPPPVILTPGNASSLAQTVDLSTLVEVSVPSVERTYIKNSLTPIPSQEILLRNLSSDVDIRASLRGASGVSFEPPVVDLQRGSTVSVNVNFDASQINLLGEGVNTFTTVFDLTSTTPILEAPIPGPSVPATPPPTEILNKWNEERFHGAPLGNMDHTDINTIFAKAPLSTQWVNSINYKNGSFPPPITVRWKGRFTFDGTRYQFNATTDDGIRVFVDNALIINDWKISGYRTLSRTLDMSAGEHDIRVEYFNGQGDGAAAFSFNKVVSPPIFTGGTVSGLIDDPWYQSGLDGFRRTDK